MNDASSMNGDSVRRVLLVEDDPGAADLVREYLMQPAPVPHEVAHVPHLAAARAELTARWFDAVLLDLRLPDGLGTECVIAVRESAPTVPIVVLTGLDDETLAIECIAAGAQDYLTKSELVPRTLLRSIAYARARTAETVAREAVSTLQGRLAAIVDASSDAIVSMALDGIVTSWNRGAARMFGFTPEEAIGARFDQVIRAAAGEDAAEQQRRIEDARQGRGIDVVHEVVRYRRDGEAMTVAVVTSALRDAAGNITDLAVICRDVTESKQRADELQRTNAKLVERGRQMQALAARLNAVREEERTSISREVHDEIGQLLTGIKMDLRWLTRHIGAQSDAQRALLDRLGEADHLVDRTLARVQRIAVELRPSTLDSLGLVAAVRDEARRFEARTGIETFVEVCSSLDPMPPETSTALFRILQELMTNVARHAHAQSLHIELSLDPHDWRMEVRDDGVGIGKGAAARVDSLGLLGMSERALAVGGRFSIGRAHGGGTVAKVVVPLARQAA